MLFLMVLMCQIVAHARAIQRLPAFSSQHGQNRRLVSQITTSRNMVTSAVDDQMSPENGEVSEDDVKSPWSTDMAPKVSKKRGINKSRFRQRK